MSEELVNHIREEILPRIIDTTKMDIWSFDWVDDGIYDFTGSVNQKKVRICLVSDDYRIELKIWLNRKTD